jgi:hypothetical protein
MEPQEPVLLRVRELLEGPEGGELDQLVELLGRRVRAVRDRRMRREVLRVALEESDDAAVVALLERIYQGTVSGRNLHRELLQELALDGSLLQDLGYDRITDLYEVAHWARLPAVTRMFLGDRHRGNVTAAEAMDDNEHLELSAGERRTLARGKDRFSLDRIVHDRDPRVIATFLDNPRAVETDVVKVAAMRPTKPEILRLIARHRRWATRYRVRLALVCNPYTPLPIATQLVPTLLLQDLREIISAIPVSPELRATARDALAARLASQGRAPGAMPSQVEESAAEEALADIRGGGEE